LTLYLKWPNDHLRLIKIQFFTTLIEKMDQEFEEAYREEKARQKASESMWFIHTAKSRICG